MKKAVVFSLWGGVISPHLRQSIENFEKSLGIQKDVISNAVLKGNGNGLISAERGKVALAQIFPDLLTACQKEAASQGVSLPSQFSVPALFDVIRGAEFIKPVLNAVSILRRHGITTCVLANIWVDDTDHRSSTAKIMSVLAQHFDLVLESCRVGSRVPEPEFFTAALEKLSVAPEQAVLFDVSEESVKEAEKLGMTGVLVGDITGALKQLQELTGVEVLDERFPFSCSPEDVTHGLVTIKPGVKTHYVEMGDGPPVLLCHGFPEIWFSWRYQIPALAKEGFRVLAPDLKGYGDSSAPPEIEEYSQEQICKDLVTFLDKMGIPQVTLVGHDWGGVLVWNMALYHPERVRAVVSLNTPLFPLDRTSDPMLKLKALPIFDYQIYFQEPGVAEAELEKDLERTFKLMFNGSDEKDKFPALKTSGVCKRGGLFVDVTEDVPRSVILSEAALKYYVQQFKKSGFRGPLNWYRNVERNWRWMCSRPRDPITMPALMVTAGKDPVLLPAFTKGMEEAIPNLKKEHIEECGHWTQMDRPAELNKILIAWLKEIHQKSPIPPKL
ncbi:bifunctional epoxide hydrolase 2 [Chanos chanos]|uniref:Bifunctional epoxide hydrolase 2 n=1 Tax=Chanos chanos TaxID=29144 RepID=A0A6J2WCH1_CHACN|nr:bifunctional epoxide hydrolase 2 [Chanos chanos]XP_030641967.1 bifunctional epoxide hydrolase 2 [Chanos chanos]